VTVLPLLSLRLLIVLGLGTVGAAAAGWWWASHRRHRAVAWVTTLLVCVAFAGSGIAAGVNRHFALYQTWSSLLGLQSRDLVAANSPAALARVTAPLPAGTSARPHGQLLSLTIPGVASHLSLGKSLIYLPAVYGSKAWEHRGFPVVEALTGSPGRPADYINGLHVDTVLDKAMRDATLPPAIVVFPPSNQNVLRSLECVDTADGLRDETFLTTDVHAWVRAHLAVAAGPWSAFGYSTGGYCALDLALRRPALFNRAISLDGYTHALSDHYARGLWPAGGAGVTARLEHSPDWWVRNHAPEPVRVYLSAGDADRDAARSATSFWTLLASTGWRLPADRLVVEPHGHHTFRDWASALLPALTWALGPDTPASSPTSAGALERLISSAADPCAAATPSGPGEASPTPAARSSAVGHSRSRRCASRHHRSAEARPSPTGSPRS
jgi:enterochelin esterase-like enzyme